MRDNMRSNSSSLFAPRRSAGSSTPLDTFAQEKWMDVLVQFAMAEVGGFTSDIAFASTYVFECWPNTPRVAYSSQPLVPSIALFRILSFPLLV